MRGLFLLVLAASCCYAEITNVRVIGTTATQAGIAYTAPDGAACSVAASQTADPSGNPLAPLVHDVDTSLFPGSDQDNRTGSIVAGRSRIFVIGKRAAEIGSDGSYDSRALQANTLYYGQVTCGSSTAQFTFQTTNVPQGLGYGDPWPTDPENPGAWAAAAGPGAAPTESYIDPQTGLLVQHYTTSGFGYTTYPNGVLNTAYNQGQQPCDSAGPWTSPCNAIGNASYASVSNSSGWLVARPNNISFGWGGIDDSYGNVIQQIRVSLTGHCDTTDSSLCQVDVCLSLNAGASCATSIQSETLPYGTDTTVSVGAYNPGAAGIDPWVYNTTPKMSRWEASTHTGNVTVSDTVLTQTGGSRFREAWTTGGQGRIRLSNVSTTDACNAASPTSIEATILSGFGNSLTLTAAPGAYAYYCAPNWAVMVRRHTADASSNILVKNLNFSYVDSNGAGWASGGHEDMCSNTIVDGGFLCMQSSGGGWAMLTWTDPATGVTNQVLPLKEPGNSTGSDTWGSFGCPLASPDVFSTIDDTINTVPTWYCVLKDGTGKWIVLQAQYTGSVTAPVPFDHNASFGTGTPVWNPATYSVTYDDAIITDLTPSSLGKDLSTLATAFTGQPLAIPGVNASLNCGQTAPVQNGVVLINCSLGSDTLGWFFAFSPGDHNPAHAGQDGGPRIIGAMNGWSHAATRFERTHAISNTGKTSGVLTATMDPLQGSALGNTSVVVTTHTPIPGTGLTPCENFGITYPSRTGWTGHGAGCIQVTIDSNSGSYEPYFLFPVTNMSQAPGALSTAQVGDLVYPWETTNPPSCWFGGSGWCEVWQLMQKGVDGDDSQWIFARNVASGNNVCPCALNEGNLKYLFFGPTNWNLNSLTPGKLTLGYGYQAYWDYVNDPFGLNTFADPGESGGHGFMRPNRSVYINNGNYMVRSGSTIEQIMAAPSNLVATSTTFAGGTPTGGTFYQSHSGPSGELASAYEAQTSFDLRPQAGQTTVAPGAPWLYTPVTGQLYVTSPTITDPDNSQIVHRKLFATVASSGTHPLADVSGPGSLLDGSAANSYKYCVVREAGECYDNSTVGQIYVNAPGVIYRWCYGPGNASGGTLTRDNDICVSDSSPLYQGLVQFASVNSDPAAANQRVLARALTGPVRASNGFQNAHALPDNSWITFPARSDGLSFNNYAVKLPPFPPADSVVRNNFVTVPVTLKPPAGVDNAIVEFGYGEYGGYCTSRSEACVANKASTGGVPFQFAGENPAGLACATGCTIAVPAISQRMLYYKVKYRDSANNVLVVAPSQVLAIP